MLCKTLLYGSFFALSTVIPAAAQQESASQAPADPTPRVSGAVSRNPETPHRAGLGEEVTVNIQGLAMLLTPGSPVRCGDLVLFLDGVAISGNPPESCSAGEGEVRFLLDRTEDSDRAWHILLSKPSGFTKKVSVSLGSDAETAYPTSVRGFELEVVPRTGLFLYFGILAAAIALLVHLGRKTSLLRAPGPMGESAPFSLSRFQLAFWSVLVLAAYLFIWMITEELDTITGSVLVLLGIGSGTALGASLMGTRPGDARPSKGFLNDLLSDDQGLSPSRFQLFAWTLVLGVIFCASVYDGLQMPQFSTTLLGLMGLSSGTYLGFKAPENRTSTPPAG